MTRITIITRGNRSLYRSLYEGMDTLSNHRSVKAAVRRIRRLTPTIDRWSKAHGGHWGTEFIYVNDERLDADETGWIFDAADDPAIERYERDAIIASRLNQAIAARVMEDAQ